MTRVDFYVLQSTQEHERHTFACRLIDKAVHKGNRVMVITNSPEETQALDEMLWAFKPESYIPHNQLIGHTKVTAPSEESEFPVAISHEFDDAHQDNLLINMCLDIPKQFSRFERVAEIVDQRAEILTATRKNYAHYKERGYPIHTHKLSF